MKTKDKIIEKIHHINNEALLEELLEMINIQLLFAKDEVKLSDEQKSAIDEGLKDIEEGRVHSNDEAQKIIAEWMKKK